MFNIFKNVVLPLIKLGDNSPTPLHHFKNSVHVGGFFFSWVQIKMLGFFHLIFHGVPLFVISVNKNYCCLKTETDCWHLQTTNFVMYSSFNISWVLVLNLKIANNGLQIGESVEGDFFLKKRFIGGQNFISKFVGGFFSMEGPMIRSCQGNGKVRKWIFQ